VTGVGSTEPASSGGAGFAGAGAGTAKAPRYASWTAGKLPLPELVEMKRRGEKIVMVTAYDAPSGRLADAAGVDLILVGDSSGMVVHGRESTVPVSLDEILFMTQWVTRGAKRPVVIADMPFGTYEASNEQAITNAIRLVKEGGADAVKLERAGTSIARAKAIVEAGIAVMGHVGLTPQTATVLGGFKAQSRTADQARKLIDDALALQEAGCFAIVLEAVPAPVARKATQALSVPTIGIGAGGDTDGQVLVWHDMLGYYEGHAPRFVKRYAELGDAITTALGRFAEEVRSGAFPEEQHTYTMPDEERAAFEARTTSRER
jgi:3-methyl-2-oxobutanoate hydroxymethyltransferase